MADRAPLTDDELDAISEKLLDKMLRKLAKLALQHDPATPSNSNGRPNKCGKVTIHPTGDERPTAEDYARAQRLHRKHSGR